jgi:hypothetical protein
LPKATNEAVCGADNHINRLSTFRKEDGEVELVRLCLRNGLEEKAGLRANYTTIFCGLGQRPIPLESSLGVAWMTVIFTSEVRVVLTY